MIYLDHNATTPLDERVLEAMLPFLKSFYGNPSSLYRLGRATRSAINRAREQVAALVDCKASQITFTSGGTEANNMALAMLKPGGRLVISAIEHASIAVTAQKLQAQQGCSLFALQVDNNGVILPESLGEAARFNPDLVSVMLANNEQGVIQDIAALAGHFNAKTTLVHTDAVQALGKIPLSFEQLGIDLMSLSSHKIYGPKGCGALIHGARAGIQALLHGGGQEQGLRAGTENVAAIVGFGKAAELAKAELAQRSTRLMTLRQLLERELVQIPGLIIFANAAERLPNTVQFGLPGVDGEMLLMQLDQKSIAVSSGSACDSGAREPSAVLKAMGVEDSLAKSAIRVSLGAANTESDMLEFVKQLKFLTGCGLGSEELCRSL
ncbi:MAG: cysteine desulfurase [Methylobacter sp.]|nr:MAG: cysteine desulfurase [Methylobacter sp.]